MKIKPYHQPILKSYRGCYVFVASFFEDEKQFLSVGAAERFDTKTVLYIDINGLVFCNLREA